jgi:hypothetical protein
MHTLLALDMNLIPEETKKFVPNFGGNRVSNDKSRMILDGYNEKGELVHPDRTLNIWLQWSDEPEKTRDLLLSTAIEYTKEELIAETKNPDSIWYNAPRDDV